MSRGAALKDGTTDAADLLATHLRLSGITGWVREHRFHPKRRWRIDIAFPALRLAMEVEGAIWVEGRHTRGSGFTADIEKYNALTLAGWRLIRVTPAMVVTGEALALLEQVLGGQ